MISTPDRVKAVEQLIWWVQDFSFPSRNEVGPNATELRKFNTKIHRFPTHGGKPIPEVSVVSNNNKTMCDSVDAKRYNVITQLLIGEAKDLLFSGLENEIPL